MTLSIKILSIMASSLKTFSITKLRIMIPSIAAFSIKTFIITTLT